MCWMKLFCCIFFFFLTFLFSIVSYLLLASGAVVMVLTSSTAELKTLMFSEEYRAAGLLYWLVTTLEPNPENGRALLLWLEPMLFTSWQFWKQEKQGSRSVSVKYRAKVRVQDSSVCEIMLTDTCGAQCKLDKIVAAAFDVVRPFYDSASTCLDMRR